MKKILICLVAIALTLISCEKFLDVKSDKKLVVISTVRDLQALMDNYDVMNEIEPGSGEVSADNYYVMDADYGGMTEGQRRMYIWEKDNFYLTTPNDWSNPYRVVYAANTVLQNADAVDAAGTDEFAQRNLIGQAYFHRGRAFYNLAQLFTMPYDPASAGSDLGIALRLDLDFNIPSKRANNEETHRQIISDLKTALQLLPVSQPSVLRPTKPAVYGMLARVYLSMNEYTEAKLYADSCIAYNFKLLDYNTLNAAASYPISRFNEEVISESRISPPAPINITISKIAPSLYSQYTNNDLRKTVFFRSNTGGTYTFKGAYEGTNGLFNGIALDEMYLTRAECLVRAGDVTSGLRDLNALLLKRYKTGTFTPYANLSKDEALNLVLSERRKELLMRGLRWTDIRRLNKLNANIVLSRTLNGVTYTLPPNSSRYALPLPEAVISLSEMTQNPR